MLLEERPDLVLCGGINVDNELVPLFASKDTGSIIYVDELNQEVLTIANMGCDDPIEQDSVDDIRPLLAEDLPGCIGAIISESAILAIVSETKMAIVPVGCTLADAEEEISITVGVESTEITYDELEEE